MQNRNTYDMFSGKDLEIAELIQQRRLQILVHSCIYYEFNSNIISDKQFDDWAKELVRLQSKYPDISGKIRYADAFEGFDGSTGFDLPIQDEWVRNKAANLLTTANQILSENKSEVPIKQMKAKKRRRRLF